MRTRALEKRDYDLIVHLIDRWWGGPTGTMVNPIFFYELGHLARVTEDAGALLAFLLGFLSVPKDSHAPVGYVHLVGVHPDHRRQGLARGLYSTFEQDCRAAGAVRLKAVTTLGNELSQRFHQSLGWDMSEHDDYAGPGRPRMVFTKALPPASAPPTS